jgi:hypothetical protein
VVIVLMVFFLADRRGVFSDSPIAPPMARTLRPCRWQAKEARTRPMRSLGIRFTLLQLAQTMCRASSLLDLPQMKFKALPETACG